MSLQHFCHEPASPLPISPESASHRSASLQPATAPDFSLLPDSSIDYFKDFPFSATQPVIKRAHYRKAGFHCCRPCQLPSSLSLLLPSALEVLLLSALEVLLPSSLADILCVFQCRGSRLMSCMLLPPRRRPGPHMLPAVTCSRCLVYGPSNTCSQFFGGDLADPCSQCLIDGLAHTRS